MPSAHLMKAAKAAKGTFIIDSSVFLLFFFGSQKNGSLSIDYITTPAQARSIALFFLVPATTSCWSIIPINVALVYT